MVGNRQDAAHYRMEAAKCHQAAIEAKDSAARLYWEQAERCWLALANQVEVSVNLLSGRNSVGAATGPRDSRRVSGTSVWCSLRPASFTYRCEFSLHAFSSQGQLREAPYTRTSITPTQRTPAFRLPTIRVGRGITPSSPR
jgi:hypothetical protein